MIKFADMATESMFKNGQIVYLKTDEEQWTRIVVAVIELYGGSYQYILKCADAESLHYECEISKEVDTMLRMGINKN